MINRQRKYLVVFFLLSDICGIFIAYFWSYFFRFYSYLIPVDPSKGIPPLKVYFFAFFVFLIIHISIFYIQGFYKTRLKRTRFDDFLLIGLNAIISVALCMGLFSYLNSYSQGQAPLFEIEIKLSHLFLVIYLISVTFLVIFLRSQIYAFMKRRYAKGLNLQNVLIVGAGEMGKVVAQKLAHYKELGFVVKGFLDDKKKKGEIINVGGGIKVLGSLKDLNSILEHEKINDVYVALDFSNYTKILETLKVVYTHVVNVRLIPDLFQLLTLKASVQELDGFPVISIDETPLSGVMRILKRAVDLVASIILIVLLFPLMIIVAGLVKLSSKGPVFYHQRRVGLDGKSFVIHKFRTMVCDAEKKTGPVMAYRNDPRITPIGRMLRKFSIDEIPQLINVLKGDMSLIGPRPERPHFVKDFREKIPKYMLRHKVKSGISGWAQVHGLRQDTPIDKRLEYDFYYIQNWSIKLDLKIIWLTIRKGFIDKTMKKN
ncbi:MAG: undecaprenyl-phosphate glucose phosphotransferase [Candidatus Aminicenantaceae bacterium]